MKMNINNRDLVNALKERVAPARLQLNIHPALHEQFKKISFNRDEQMSDLITQFVIDYVSQHGEPIDPQTAVMYMSKPKDWTL
ncbi:hypothetical protein DFV88_24780 [Salmonella enterica subsp. enterica serovar Newport]|nr:hypothetical protein [Salmonella enterica subsp. enterica serovar Newport]